MTRAKTTPKNPSVRRKTTKRSLENPAVPLWSPGAVNYLGSPRSSSGMAIDRLSVLAYPAVWRSLDLVSKKIARLPLSVFKRNKQGGREQDYEHPAYWLLARRPSDLYTPMTWKTTMMVHALLHGNGYTWIVREGAKPVELITLNPETTGVAVTNGQLKYFVRMGTDTRTILPENMIHLKGIGHDGLVGYSVIDLLRESFGLGLAAQKYGAVYFRNNGSPGPTVLSFPGKMDKDQQAQTREQIEKYHSGLDNSHRPMILCNGGTLTNFKIDNNAAQFLETREHEIACGIANIFGVPARKLGVNVNSSYGALDVDEQSFLHDTVDPWLVSFEEELEAKLLKESQQVRDSHFIEFDRSSLQQADYDKKSSTLLAQLNGGGLTFNQWASAMNLPGIGADGDRLRCPAGTTYLDMIDQQAELADQLAEDPAEDQQEPTSEVEGNLDEVAAGETDGKSPVDGDPVDGNQPLRQLLASVITRYVARVRKAASAASKRADWPDWLSTGLERHRRILCDSVAPVRADADACAAQLLDALRVELAAVTRDQVQLVFDRVNVEDWTEAILNKGE